MSCHLAKDQDHLGDHPHRHHSHDVAGDEKESLLGGGAEAVAENRGLYVGVLVEKLHALLEAPQAALHAAQNGLVYLLGKGIVGGGGAVRVRKQPRTWSGSEREILCPHFDAGSTLPAANRI